MIKEQKSANERLNEVNSNIERALNRMNNYDSSRKKPNLIAVSKLFGKEKIIELIKAGQKIFGENRVQEAQAKWPEIKKTYPDIELHLIGSLQTNKVRDAVEIFDVIEVVDREKLAKKLRQEMDRVNKNLPCFVQVNIGQEPQKGGIEPRICVDFVKKCQNEHGLNIIGLMCIPPKNEASAPYFALLADLAKRAGVENLSMGMSKDYEIATMMGATHIRVGEALFGKRNS